MKKILRICVVLGLTAGVAWATGNIVPRSNNSGTVGTTSKRWATIYGVTLDLTNGAKFSPSLLVTNAGGEGAIKVYGGETNSAVLYLFADNDDDTADEWSVRSETGNNLAFENNGTDKLTLSSAGVLSTVGDIVNAGGDITCTNASAATSTFKMSSADTRSVLIQLEADRRENAGDIVGLLVADGAGLAFQTDADSAGTLATKLTMGTTGILTLKGSGTIDNTTDTGTMKLTETVVQAVGNVNITGALTVTGLVSVVGADIAGLTAINLDLGESTPGTLSVTATNTSLSGNLNVTGNGRVVGYQSFDVGASATITNGQVIAASTKSAIILKSAREMSTNTVANPAVVGQLLTIMVDSTQSATNFFKLADSATFECGAGWTGGVNDVINLIGETTSKWRELSRANND